MACIGLGSASGWPRCRLYSWPGHASPILSHTDWPHHAEPPALLAWGCPSSPSVHLHPPVASLAPSNCLTIKPSSWKNLPCFLYTNDSIVHTYLYGRTAYARTHPKSNLFQDTPQIQPVPWLLQPPSEAEKLPCLTSAANTNVELSMCHTGVCVSHINTMK